MILRKIFGVCIAISLSLTPCFAADWPMFRSNAGNTGASGETITLPLTEIWHSSAPLVEENGAAVSNGVVYMMANDGNLYAFDVATGFAVTGFPVSIGSSFGAPAVDAANGKIYTLVSGTFSAHNLNGTLAWSKSVGSSGANYNQSAVIDNGFVYVKAGGNIYKYDSAGTLQWSSATSGSSTQPSIMGDNVYSNSESGQIRKYDKTTGTEITGGGFPISTGASQSAVTTVNGKIFIKSNLLYAYDASTGGLLWSQAIGGDSTYSDSPAVSGGFVYVYGWDSVLYAFDETTGAIPTGFPSAVLNATGDRNWSSPAVAGDKVFVVAGTTQRLKVLGAAGSAQAGQVLEEHQTFSADTQGFDLCSPIVSDGWVFAMLDGGGLYAFFAGGTAPGGALVINGGDNCTASQGVVLTLNNNGNESITEMRISEDPLFGDASWETFATTKNWTLSSGFGTKTVYAQFRGGGQTTNVFTAQIDYSETCELNPPSNTFNLRRDGIGDGMNILNCGTVFDVDGKGGPGSGPWSGAALFTLYFVLFLLPVWILKRLHGTKRSFARPALLSLLVVLALILTAALPAGAGELVAKAQRFHPTSDGFGTLTLDSDQVLGKEDWAFVSTLNYASRPLNLGDTRNLIVQRDRVRDLITLDMAGAYGFGKNLSFGIDLPINMLIEGRNSAGQQGHSYTLGDIRLNGKWQFLSRPDYGLAFVPFFNIPMGNKEFLLTEDRYGWGGKLAGHWAQSERLTLLANLGVELVSTPFRSRIFSSWLQYGIGMDYKLATKGASIVAEINGETTLDKVWDHTVVSPFELLAAYRKNWTPGWTYEVGAGLGLNKGMGAPAYRALAGVSYLFGAPK